MADRQPIASKLSVSPRLAELLQRAREREVTEEELREQRVSFAYGNALESPLITKDSVRLAAKRIRLSPPQ